MPSSTSIENYHEHRRSGKLSAQEQEIIDFLKRYPDRNWTRSEISEEIGMRLSSVCGRVNKLVKERYIRARPVRNCSITGQPVTTVRIPRAEH